MPLLDDIDVARVAKDVYGDITSGLKGGKMFLEGRGLDVDGDSGLRDVEHALDDARELRGIKKKRITNSNHQSARKTGRMSSHQQTSQIYHLVSLLIINTSRGAKGRSLQ
jgi:hypothetical protein